MTQQFETLTKQEKLNISLKEISQRVRKHLKVEFPGLKWSIRTEYYSGGQSLHVSLMESKSTRFLKRFDEITDMAKHFYNQNMYSNEQIKSMTERTYHQLNQYTVCEEYNPDKWCNGAFLTREGHDVLGKVVKMIQHYNWDNSDTMIDYFDVKFYLHIELGKWDRPFIDGGLK